MNKSPIARRPNKDMQPYMRYIGHLVLFEVDTPRSKEAPFQTVALIVHEVIARKTGVFLRGTNLKRVEHPSMKSKAVRDYNVAQLRTHITDMGRLESPAEGLNVLRFPSPINIEME